MCVMTVLMSMIYIEKHKRYCSALSCCKSILIVIFMFGLILSTIQIHVIETECQ